MASLKFVTGTVACGKTTELIITANQLKSLNGAERIMILKPLIDTRYGTDAVRAANGLEVKATNLIAPIDNLLNLDYSDIDYIFVDEIQFFPVKQIEQLRVISAKYNIETVCYGLLKDFRCAMFDTSKRLLELCDNFRMIQPYCYLCKSIKERCGKVANLATVSMKIVKTKSGMKPVVDGSSICIGGIDMFIPVCYDCYNAEAGLLKD